MLLVHEFDVLIKGSLPFFVSAVVFLSKVEHKIPMEELLSKLNSNITKV